MRGGHFYSRSRRLRLESLENRLLLAITGDYDESGTVNNGDYDTWRANFGNIVAPGSGADGSDNGVVDAADYVVWRKNIGATGSGDRINLSIDRLSEAVEETPGAIIWRNNDFSKQVAAGSQPESGLPLYVPDYMAGSTVYDPSSALDFTDASVTIDNDMVAGYAVKFTYDTAKLRLWTTTSWTGMTNVGSGRFQIPSGVNLTPGGSLLNFEIEGLANSGSFATDSIFVEAIPTGGGTTLNDRGYYTVVETGVGVDGNRDTEIEFNNNHDRQLLFWFNNDKEGQHSSDEEVESEDPNIINADNTDNVIGQRRDLEDLAPLRVSAPQLLVQNAFDTAQAGAPDPGQLRVTYRINLVNPAGATVRLFYSNNDTEDAILHVSDDTTADTQATDSFFRMQAGPSFANTQQLQQISAGLNAFLFEAIGAGYGSTFTATPTLQFETVIQYADGSTTSKIQSVELDLRDIKQFYTQWDVNYGVNNGQSGTDLRPDLTFQHFATPTTPTHTSQVTEVPFFSGDDTVVFVHGWNMTDTPNNDWKAAFGETMFKRLYWQGLRGEFVAFNWPTYANEEGPIEPPFEDFNQTYNPSDIQAYRSAQALREILEDYRGESEDLQPVHVLAHSMGNVVVGEAMRQWASDPNTEDPLVTTYIAMQAAVSSGAYGSNDTDSMIVGRPIPDLFRFWSHGRDGFSDPGLGLAYYFQGANFSWENGVNLYNENDVALGAWDLNNFGKDLYIQPPGWPYDYDFEAGDGENVNNDIFTRFPDVGAPVNLTLTLPNGQPGANAYEILAFFSQSASLALGTKPVNFFDSNFDLENFTMPGGSDIRANHSYEFHHDAATTWDFYELLKTEMGFGATHGSGAIASASAIRTDSTSAKPTIPDVVTTSTEPQRLSSESTQVVGATWLTFSSSSRELLSPTSSSSPPLGMAGRSRLIDRHFDLALLNWLDMRPTEPNTEPDSKELIANDAFFEQYQTNSYSTVSSLYDELEALKVSLES